MDRLPSTPRANWQTKLEEQGFVFHSDGGSYWDESVCFRFTSSEVDVVEAATNELHSLCMDAVDRLIAAGRLEHFGLPLAFLPWIEDSWKRRDPHLYGRFDLAWNGDGQPKMLEYNADTPTTLVEAAVAQWHWLLAVRPGMDQFNSIHERLIDRWKSITAPASGITHFACMQNSLEDRSTALYLADCAAQAGHHVRNLPVELLGWDSSRRRFVDTANDPIEQLFKLYPTEWLVAEEFGAHLLEQSVKLIEPPWKILLSSKAILPLLWEMNPGHPNLLPSFFGDAPETGIWATKPVFSREGANIQLTQNGRVTTRTDGDYGAGKVIHQALAPLFVAGEKHAVIGSWVVGDEAAGMGIREDVSPITSNASRFIPHFFE